jgi:hypothetical protein
MANGSPLMMRLVRAQRTAQTVPARSRSLRTVKRSGALAFRPARHGPLLLRASTVRGGPTRSRCVCSATLPPVGCSRLPAPRRPRAVSASGRTWPNPNCAVARAAIHSSPRRGDSIQSVGALLKAHRIGPQLSPSSAVLVGVGRRRRNRTASASGPCAPARAWPSWPAASALASPASLRPAGPPPRATTSACSAAVRAEVTLTCPWPVDRLLQQQRLRGPSPDPEPLDPVSLDLVSLDSVPGARSAGWRRGSGRGRWVVGQDRSSPEAAGAVRSPP